MPGYVTSDTVARTFTIFTDNFEDALTATIVVSSTITVPTDQNGGETTFTNEFQFELNIIDPCETTELIGDIADTSTISQMINGENDDTVTLYKL